MKPYSHKVCLRSFLRISECSAFVSIFTPVNRRLRHDEWKLILLSREGCVVQALLLRDVLHDVIESTYSRQR